MTTIRPRQARAIRPFTSLTTEIPMTNRHAADQSTTVTVRTDSARNIAMRSTAMHLLHEDLARAQIHERVNTTKEGRRAAQLVRARRLSRKAQEAAIRARLIRARFN